MKIFKYALRTADEFQIEMPYQALILSVQMQGGIPWVWALVDPRADKVQRKFSIRGTGHDATFTEPVTFVGTFQMGIDALVFHLFDRGEV